MKPEKALIELIRLLPRRVALAMGAQLGSLVFRFSKREKFRAIENLTKYLELDRSEAEKVALGCFRNMGKNLMEFIQIPYLSPEMLRKLAPIEGKTYIDSALKLGKGAIISTGHIGNWEMLGGSLVAHGYTLNVVARKLRSDKLDRLVTEHRENSGYRCLDRDKSIREVFKALKRNELVAILADVDSTKIDGIFVDFFGRLARTPYGHIAIAFRTGAVILPSFIVRKSDGFHGVKITPPLTLSRSDNLENDLFENTRRYNEMVEKEIRNNPEQWIWMHDRWRTRPPNET